MRSASGWAQYIALCRAISSQSLSVNAQPADLVLDGIPRVLREVPLLGAVPWGNRLALVEAELEGLGPGESNSLSGLLLLSSTVWPAVRILRFSR